MDRLKAKLRDNRGFSLVEMIICIAIIVIMSGVAMVTITLLNSAKAKEASVTFESTLSDMITKTKNQVCVISGVQYPKYDRCMNIYKHSDGKYYIRTGYYDPDNAGSPSAYIFIDDENVNDGRGVSMTSKVIIKYTATGTTDKVDIDDTGVYIVYDRRGLCIEGSGIYSFYKKNGNAIADVVIQKNGSHQSN